jgi:DNA polymerase-3 subunit gamma/tau
MQLASITFDGEKKNSKNFIIPPSYFKKKGIKPIPVKLAEKSQENTDDKIDIEFKESIESEKTLVKDIKVEEPSIDTLVKEPPPKIILKSDTKRVSGLSLSSIKTKKEFEIRQLDVIIDEDNLPKDDFTEELLIKTWNKYIVTLENKGKYNLASILSIDVPKLNNNTIHLTYPNETNKVEIERHQYKLLSFLRKKLNNFSIDLSIDINEELEKKYAYTPKEKYEKLIEKNSNLDTLRKTFDLDI